MGEVFTKRKYLHLRRQSMQMIAYYRDDRRVMKDEGYSRFHAFPVQFRVLDFSLSELGLAINVQSQFAMTEV